MGHGWWSPAGRWSAIVCQLICCREFRPRRGLAELPGGRPKATLPAAQGYVMLCDTRHSSPLAGEGPGVRGLLGFSSVVVRTAYSGEGIGVSTTGSSGQRSGDRPLGARIESQKPQQTAPPRENRPPGGGSGSSNSARRAIRSPAPRLPRCRAIGWCRSTLIAAL